jgi:ABC-type dipeptide/oligopeptide/nickel transport system ATPase component
MREEQQARLPVHDAAGCKFVARCPVAMPLCRQTAPALFHTEARRVVACHQYAESGVVPLDAMADVFALD